MKWFFLFSSCLFSTPAISQILKSESLELSFDMEHEIQGHFVTQYGTRSYLTDLKLTGTNAGAHFGYKMLFKKGWYILPSMGYFKYAVNDIVNKSIPAFPFGTTNSRSIDYQPDSTPLGYSTQKYHYNNFSAGIALGKEFIVNSKYQLAAGMCFNYLFNYSQKYYIGKAEYSTNTRSTFGYLVTGSIGINRIFKKFYIGTNFLLPVYKQLKKDKVLFDNPDEKVETWFGGYGFLLKIGKYIKW